MCHLLYDILIDIRHFCKYQHMHLVPGIPVYVCEEKA